MTLKCAHCDEVIPIGSQYRLDGENQPVHAGVCYNYIQQNHE